MKILITGDSHTGPVRRGLGMLREQQELDPTIEITVRPLGGGHLLPSAFFEDAGDHARIVDPEYQRMFARIPPLEPKYDAMVLSMPLLPMRMLYKVNREKLALAQTIPDRRPVSLAAFKVIVLDEMKYVLDLIALLQRIGMPVAATSPPHLFRDHASLKTEPKAHTLKCWYGYLDVMRAELAARGVAVIDLPEAAVDAEGFMLPAYRHEDPNDAHHGNAKLGALMIQSVERWARGLKG